jgi:DNA-binding NarL/FixJ family response regulator
MAEVRTVAAPIRVVLVNQTPEVAAALIEVFRHDTEFYIVGVASGFQEGAQVIATLEPDIVLTDLDPSGSGDATGLARLRGARQAAQIVVLSSEDSPARIRAAVTQGVRGYILKETSTSDFLHGIRAVVAGQRHYSPRIAGLVAGGKRGSRQVGPRSSIGITERESEVLAMIAGGHCNKRMAAELNVSVKTVEKHRANVMQKLKLHNVADLTRFAIHNQFVTVEGQRRQRRTIADMPNSAAPGHTPARWIRIDHLPFAVAGCDALVCSCPYRFLVDRRITERRHVIRGAAGTVDRMPDKRRPHRGKRATDHG